MKQPIIIEMKSTFKSFLFLMGFIFCLTGCMTMRPTPVSHVSTVNSDLFPQDMSRAQYYEQLARGYSGEGQSDKAIDYYRLSLLHDPERTSAHMALAEEYSKAKMDLLATNELSIVLKNEPTNKAALLKIADIYVSSQIYSKAKEAFSEVLKLDENHEEARWALFYISILQKDYAMAEQELDHIVVTDKNRAKLAYERALIAKHYEKFNKYAKLISLAYAIDPRDKKITLEMKNHYLKMFEFQNATDVLKFYSQTHDFDMEISENLTFTAVRSENYDIALAELDKQKNWSKEYAVIDMKKAHVYFLSDDIPMAEKLYAQAISYQSNLDEARFYLAQIYLSQNKLSSAQTILEELSVSSDYFAEAQVRLAFFEKANGKNDLAVNRIRQAHQQRPDQLLVYKAYADFLIEAKRYVESIALLEKGIGYFPNDEDLRIKVAFVHYRLRNHRSFKKHIAKALQINPKSSEVYSYLAELWYLKNKDPRDVEFFANKALEFKTNNKNVKPLLAWSLLAQDRSTEAVALFEKFYEENPNQVYYAEALAKVYEAADVNLKAKQMSLLANKLQNYDRLKSGLILDSNNKSIDSNQPNASPVRLPASLEN